jgi:hypothetical protein
LYSPALANQLPILVGGVSLHFLLTAMLVAKRRLVTGADDQTNVPQLEHLPGPLSHFLHQKLLAASFLNDLLGHMAEEGVNKLDPGERIANRAGAVKVE